MMFMYFFAIFLFIVLALLLCLTVLVQESKSMGLGASFGGDASDSVFGTSTADVLKKFTAWLGVAFLVSCLVLSIWTSALARAHRTYTSDAQTELEAP